MNKHTIYFKFLLAAVLLSFLGSCKKDFLEVMPKGKLIARKTADYDMLLNNFSTFSINSGNQVIMGDEVAAIDPSFSGSASVRTRRFFAWEKDIYEPEENADELAALRLLYNLNIIINEVMQSEGGTEEKKKSLQAEALAGRAWIYFHLINYYGKPYQASTSATDPGFPIIKKADVSETEFPRASVKEVYDFMINDLTTAIPALPAQATHRMRMFRGAAEALLGKVYMFMGKYGDALTHLNAALAAINNAGLPIQLYDYNETFAAGGTFLPVTTYGPSMPVPINNEENVYFRQFSNPFVSNGQLVIPSYTADLFGASDLRRKFFMTTPTNSSATYPSGLFRVAKQSVTQFGVVLPDVYLLRAEARARTNDLEGAVTDLEALREKRIAATDNAGNPINDAKVPSGIASDQHELIRFILDERIREFAMQGFRWFDMRRLSVDPDFSNTVRTSHILYSENGDVKATYTLQPERLTLRIPKKILNNNLNMPDNP